jgi:formate dehydrogenase subunit gamma
MATDRAATRARTREVTVRRNRRASRWSHAAVYTVSLLLLATGAWLFFGQEGNPSPLARVTGQPDVVLHRWLGYVLAGLAVVVVAVWWRGLGRFFRESVRWDRGDLTWLRVWPRAVLTGRFGRHEGDFDPGQRVANLVLVGSLLLLLVSGLGITVLHGGPVFVWLHLVHVWSTYVFAVMVAGHVLVASGLLPGYRGVWRAMHLGGHLPEAVARRLWPGWAERQRHRP